YGLAVQEGDVLIQSGTQNGSIEGVLTNETSTPISGEKVTLRNVASKTDTDLTTDSDGQFSASQLIPGEYEVRVNSKLASSKIRIVSDLTTVVKLILKASGPPQVKSASIDLSQFRLKHFSLNALTNGFR